MVHEIERGQPARYKVFKRHFQRTVEENRGSARTLIDTRQGGFERFIRRKRFATVAWWCSFAICIVGVLMTIGFGSQPYVLFVGVSCALGSLMLFGSDPYDDLIQGFLEAERLIDCQPEGILNLSFEDVRKRYHLHLVEMARLVLTAEEKPGEFSTFYEREASPDNNQAWVLQQFKQHLELAKYLGLVKPDSPWNKFFDRARQKGPFRLSGADRDIDLPVL